MGRKRLKDWRTVLRSGIGLSFFEKIMAVEFTMNKDWKIKKTVLLRTPLA